MYEAERLCCPFNLQTLLTTYCDICWGGFVWGGFQPISGIPARDIRGRRGKKKRTSRRHGDRWGRIAAIDKTTK